MACFDLNPFDGLTLRSQHSCNQGMSNTCDCCLTAQVMLGSLPMSFRESKVLLSLQGVSESLYDYVCLMAQYLTGLKWIYECHCWWVVFFLPLRF